MKDECGIFANYQFKENITTCNNVINGLKKIQHRGQESCGIAFEASDLIASASMSSTKSNFIQSNNSDVEGFFLIPFTSLRE